MAVRVKTEQGDRWFRAQGPGFAVALLVSVIVGGTIGYMLIEGWNAWDAFYMTVITVTTVGYKEVHDLSRAGQLVHRLPAVRRRRIGALHLHAAGDGRRRGRPPQAASAPARSTHARHDERSLHHLRLRPHRQHRGAPVPPPERAVRRRRARSGASAGGDRRWRAGGGGGCEPGGSAERASASSARAA